MAKKRKPKALAKSNNPLGVIITPENTAISLDHEIELMNRLLAGATADPASHRAAVKLLDDLNGLFRADSKLNEKLYQLLELEQIALDLIGAIERETEIDFDSVKESMRLRLEELSNE